MIEVSTEKGTENFCNNALATRIDAVIRPFLVDTSINRKNIRFISYFTLEFRLQELFLKYKPTDKSESKLKGITQQQQEIIMSYMGGNIFTTSTSIIRLYPSSILACLASSPEISNLQGLFRYVLDI